MGKCPKCDKSVNRANLTAIEAGVLFGPQFKAITYDCPWCHAVLSVAIDPVALKADIINGVVAKLKK